MNKLYLILLLLLFSIKISNAQINIEEVLVAIKSNNSKEYFTDWVEKYRKINTLDNKQNIQLLDALLYRTEQLKFNKINAQLLYVKSLKYNHKGNYALSLSIIDQIIPTLKKHKDKYLGACYNSTSDMLSKLGDETTALIYIKRAVEITNDSSYNAPLTLKINNYLVYGAILSRMNKTDLANKKYLLALEELKADPNLAQSREMGFTLLNLTEKSYNNKEYNKVLGQLNTVINLSKKRKYFYILSNAYIKKATTFKSLKSLDSAFTYVNKSLKVSKKHKHNSNYLSGLKLKSELFELKNNSTKAYETLLKYTNFKKNNIAINKLGMSKFLLSTQKRKDKLKINQFNSIAKGKREWLILIIGFMVLFILFSSILLWQRNKGKTLNEKIKKEILERKLIQSQMSKITSQMNPHFVFNALNSIQYLILQKNIKSSSIYLDNFAELMRNVLENSKNNLISIYDEMKVLKLYLELEVLRFDEDFEYSINCDFSEDEQILETIPTMLLQPYIENSIKHGLLHKKGDKTLTINFFKNKFEDLSCEIIDNGVGIKKSIEINERRLVKHKSFSTSANQERIDLINKISKKKTLLTISDIINDNEVVGTKVLFVFNQKK